MFKLTQHLMNGSYFDRVLFAPPNDNAGGNDEVFDSIPPSDATDDDEGDGGQDDDRSNNDSRGNDEITDDPEEFMRDLFGAGEDDDEDDEEESPEALKAAQDEMTERLKTGIANLTLPPDLFGEDFDPSDPKQLSEAFQKVQANTVTQALRLIFQPVQDTMNRMAVQMRREMKQTNRDGRNQLVERDALREAFPGIDNSAVAPAIKFAYDKAKIKHPNDRKAAFAATKKALQTLGVTGWDTAPKKGQRNQSESGSTYLEGRDAFDGLGLVMPSLKPQSRMRGRS